MKRSTYLRLFFDLVGLPIISFILSVIFTLASLSIFKPSHGLFFDLHLGIISSIIFILVPVLFASLNNKRCALIISYLIGISLTLYFIGWSYWPENSQLAYQPTAIPSATTLIIGTCLFIYFALKPNALTKVLTRR